VKRFAPAGLVVALAVVLLPPAVWSYSVIGDRGNANLPYVDPGSSSTLALRRGTGPGNPAAANRALVSYLQANRGDAAWLAATESSMTASSIIIATGEPVMAMGGFNGGDPAINADGVAKLVDNGELRFFLLGGAGGPPGFDGRPGLADRPVRPGYAPTANGYAPARPGYAPPANGNAPLRPDDAPPALNGPRAGNRGVSTAVTSACKAVDASAYGGGSIGGGPGGPAQLYDCQGAGDAIRAAAKAAQP